MSETIRETPRTPAALRPLEGNSPLLLDEPGTAWVVEAGSVDIFAVNLSGGIPAGARHYQFSVAAGAAMFGLDAGDGDAGIGLLAVGAMGTMVRKLVLTDFPATVPEGGTSSSVPALVDAWISGLANGAADEGDLKTEHQLDGARLTTLEPGQRLRPSEGVAWVEVKTGEVQFLDAAQVPAESSQGPFPLAERTWVRATVASTIAAAGPTTSMGPTTLWQGLATYHRLIVQGIARRLELEAGQEADRLVREAAFDESVRQRALTQLAGVLNRETVTESPATSDDPLFEAFRLVTQAMGVTIERTPRTTVESGEDALGQLAREARLRIRQVTLTDNWWRADSGPILSFAGADRTPVALLRGTKGRYELVNPADGSRSVVDRDVASAVENEAWVVYRPFPSRALGVKDLFRFGATGSSGDFVRIGLMGLATGLLATLTPIATGIVFGSIIPEAEEYRLVQLAIVLILSAVALSLFQITRSVAITRIEARIDASVQPAVWDRLLSLPTGFFRDYAAGNLASRAIGIDTARQLLTGTTITSILGSTFSLFSFALLFYYDVQLALIATVFTAIALLVAFVSTYRQLALQRKMTAIQSNITGMVFQFLSGIPKLRVAGAEDRAYGRWATLFAEQKRQNSTTQGMANGFGVFGSTWPVLGTVAIFAFVATSDSASISTANLLAFLVAFAQFLAAALLTATALSSVLQCVPLYEQARPILQTLPEVDFAKTDPGTLSGAIEIGHVSFRYTSESPLALNDVSIRIEPGQFVALVGPSGSGKSSVFRLLLGFETPETGSVYFDGKDVTGLNAEALRRQMGVVTQDSKVLPGTILANIVGASLLTIDDAWEAARLAGLDTDIREMPMGMQTVVSEGGSTFSGGQLQRLMIARAIVRRPRILLFDEATSALDNRTQTIVSRSLDNLQATRIVIAHRLSTIENADRIYVVEAGRITQSGTYRELIDAPGPFAALASRQLA